MAKDWLDSRCHCYPFMRLQSTLEPTFGAEVEVDESSVNMNSRIGYPSSAVPTKVGSGLASLEPTSCFEKDQGRFMPARVGPFHNVLTSVLRDAGRYSTAIS